MLVGVTLSDAIVRCRDGRTARVPWCELRGARESLRPSPLARYLCSALPKSIRAGAAIGGDTLRRLRVRATRRQIADGTLDRFFLADPRISLARLGFLIAITCAVGVAVFELSISTMRGMGLAFYDASDEFLLRFRYTYIGFSTLFAVVVPPLLLVADAIFHRRPRALALHATAGGATVYYDDGRVEHRRWVDRLAASPPRWRQDTRSGALRNVLSCIDGNGAELRVLEAAIARHLRRAPRQETRTEQLRSVPWATFVLGAFCAGVLAAALAAGQLAPPEPRPRGYEPASLGTVVAIAVTLWLFWCVLPTFGAFAQFGWHRVRLRFSQMWQRRRAY